MAARRAAVSSSSGPSSGTDELTKRPRRPAGCGAACGIGGTIPSSCRSASSAALATAFLPGGSSGRKRSVSRTQPRSTDRNHAGPPRTVPTTISVEPPPTSQTATVSGGSSAQLATAPRYARRPSSSAETTRAGAPAARARVHELLGVRTLAAGRCDDDLDAGGAELAGDPAVTGATPRPPRACGARIRPWRSTSSPRSNTAFSSRSGSSPRPSRSATSRRTVFDPTSTAATLIAQGTLQESSAVTGVRERGGKTAAAHRLAHQHLVRPAPRLVLLRSRAPPGSVRTEIPRLEVVLQ